MSIRSSSGDTTSTVVTESIKEVKVVTVGESAVGKSSLALRFVHNHFKDSVVATIGASFLSRTIPVAPCGFVKFNVWDTAGQEKYRSLASLYYRGVDCAIIVYDISNRESFDAVRSFWINELALQCADYDSLLIAIVGNKSDLDDLREVSEKEAKEFANEHGAIFFECSAKTDHNVNELFEAIANDLPERTRSMSTASSLNVYKVHVPEVRRGCC